MMYTHTTHLPYAYIIIVRYNITRVYRTTAVRTIMDLTILV